LRGHRELAARPVDDPADPVLEPDGRPRDLEVDELLGVQGRHQRPVPPFDEVPGGDGCGLAPVVPAADGGDHCGPLEVGRQLGPDVGVAPRAEPTAAAGYEPACIITRWTASPSPTGRRATSPVSSRSGSRCTISTRPRCRSWRPTSPTGRRGANAARSTRT